MKLIDDKFDSSDVDTSDRLVKVLCRRGMLDPFENNPMEVAGAKQWK